MNKPLIDEIVNKIVNSFTDKLCYDYYNIVIRKDLDFDITAYYIVGSPQEMTREAVFQYIYNQVWDSAHSKMADEEVERIFLTS